MSVPANDPPVTLHATTLAVGARGLLIQGKSGSGKSALALQMIALGASLVSDDQTVIAPHAGQLIASPPAAIAGGIEARGIGLIAAPYLPHTIIVAAMNMDKMEHDRLPPPRETTIAGVSLPLFYKCDGPHAAAALLLFLRHGMFQRPYFEGKGASVK
ncbi:HPr kinase/phosphorylase [Nereida sp. MMG025]|uniref:HPr kinase/phosphorylase n=1 Tax=Nereida sp. MMG025 TaxID=2909981 RepID=UPI001F368A0A|nr:HPr kinase/phosphatase C-terminal domain-containing protein [Nereida sp. MMG025]MCF6445949.1 HPr kinase/phosphatase C-terminal domain-containing protein [Nereida sp. MMG025]